MTKSVIRLIDYSLEQLEAIENIEFWLNHAKINCKDGDFVHSAICIKHAEQSFEVLVK